MHTILPFLSSELRVITAVYGALTLRLLFLSLVHLPARRGGRCHSFTTILGLRESRCPKQGRSAGTASTPGLTDPGAQEFPGSMALGRMLSYHPPLVLRLAERAEPVRQVGKRLGQREGQARRVTQPGGSELTRLWSSRSTALPLIPCTLQPTSCYMYTNCCLCASRMDVIWAAHRKCV